MNRKRAFACIGAILALLIPEASSQIGRTVLTISLDKPVSKVSPMLYGLMTEEINYSYDGGLYAELVRNRTFRSDWSGILNWFLVEKGGASAKMTVDNTQGPSRALPHS